LISLLLAAGCSTRRPSPDAGLASPAIEVRGPRGELRLALAPRTVGWVLRLPGEAQMVVRATAQGAEVIDRQARSTVLRAGPAGMALELPEGPSLRVTAAGERVTVIDAQGVILVSVDATVARDGAGRVAHTVEPGGDRLLVLGAGGERLGTVHQLPAGPTAAVLAAGGLEPRARAAIAAWLLAR
jgi:hypothetical protein